MPLNFLTCCFSCQRDNDGRREVIDVGEGDEEGDSSSGSGSNTLENFSGARPRTSTTTSRHFSQRSQEPTLTPSPPQSPSNIVADIVYDEEILSTLAAHSTTATTSATTTTTKDPEEGEDIKKFYSFKCLVCYKSIIPRQVILPCGHSQCCEA